MKSETKFKFLMIVSIALIMVVLVYNIFQDYFITEIGGYLKRRIYYERVIQKKDLPLHEGKYWREKK